MVVVWNLFSLSDHFLTGPPQLSTTWDGKIFGPLENRVRGLGPLIQFEESATPLVCLSLCLFLSFTKLSSFCWPTSGINREPDWQKADFDPAAIESAGKSACPLLCLGCDPYASHPGPFLGFSPKTLASFARLYPTDQKGVRRKGCRVCRLCG